MSGESQRRILITFIILLQIMNWVLCKPFQNEIRDQIFQIQWRENQILKHRGTADAVHGERFKGVDALGSKPPNCEYKCRGCNPCLAIQVPTTKLQYGNYEAEGWKCKCGLSFFNP